jgi:methyltransferase (TIGR00027 family)
MPIKSTESDGGIADPAGATSRLTAAARARETLRDDRLFDDAYAGDLAGAEGFDALDRHNAGLAAAGRASPNPIFAIRTRFFDDLLMAQTARPSVRQIVLIAAGLDTRGFRIGWPSGTRLFELDQPEVLSYKDRILRHAQATPTCDRRVVAVDLRDRWSTPLLEAGFRPEEGAVWLAEGLTMYLDEAAVRDLLSDVARLALTGDSFGCDFLTQQPPGVEAATGYMTEDPGPLFSACGWVAERHAFDRVGEIYGRAWPSPIRPMGFMTIAQRSG